MKITPEIRAHLRRAHGIEEGAVFDPYLHAEVPAACFGPLPLSEDDQGGPSPLNPTKDLREALALSNGKETS